MNFSVVCDANNGFWGEVDWLDFLVHFHYNVFCFDQWHSSGILQQFKGATLGGSSFSYLFVIRMEALSRLIFKAVKGEGGIYQATR